MIRIPSIGRGALLATLLATSSLALAPAHAQAIVQQPTPNADRLSAQMRILATSPNDLDALIEAGRLSTRLGDPEAAVQFFARAEKVSPRDPRVLAGRGSALLAMERPGEALRLFTAAERAGLPARVFAADRGLAFDLLGYPTNAQHDYRLALAQEQDDEVTRRLALSLGITGDLRAANQLLDPMLRQGDRSAWRVHACVLAMQGDAAGADRIAATMLPGFGAQLAPFFRRLPTLSPADRAFAVHFGRLGSTPARVADARLAPPVTPAPRAQAPVAVAAAPSTQPAQAGGRTRRPSARERRAAAAAARRETEARQHEAEVAAARKAEADRVAQAAEAARVAEAARAAEAARVAAVTRAAQDAAAEAARRAEAERVAQAERAAEAARAAEAQRLAEAARLADAQRAAAAADAREAQDAAAAAPVETAAAAPTPPAPARSNAAAAATDTTLATIIRNLTIPATELGVRPLPSAAPAPAPAPAEPVAAEPAAPAPAPKAEPVRAAAKEKAAKAAAETKAKDAPAKAAAAQGEAKPAAKAKAKAKAKPDPAKQEPAREWVQVAGGANKADLPKAFRALVEKAPVLKGRSAWTTPLRFTNRLLVGPFKTDEEAQAFVNKLAGQSVSAFVWSSEAGQKIEQLPK